MTKPSKLDQTTQLYARTETDNETTYICGLQPKVSDVTKWLHANQSSYLTLAADTLIVDADAVWPVEVGVQIVARSIDVQLASATINIQSAGDITALEICFREVNGNLSVGWQGSESQKIGLQSSSTCVFTWAKDGDLNQTCDNEYAFAENLKTWAARNALRASFGSGAQLIYNPATAVTAVATLQWVADACTAILTHGGNPRPLAQDIGASINDLLHQANALLIYARSRATGITVVPLLSETYYADRIQTLLNVAKAYQAKVDNLESKKNIEQTLEDFATSLTEVTQNSEQPLRDELKAYGQSYDGTYQDYLKLVGLFSVQQGAVKKARANLDEAIKKARIKEIIQGVFGLVESGIDAAKAGAEFAGEDYPAAAGDAFSSFQKYIDALDKLDDDSLPTLKEKADGLKQNLSSISAVGKKAYDVWESVIYAEGHVSFQEAGDLSQALSDASVGGDPGLSWKIFREQVSATLDSVLSAADGVGEAATAYKSTLNTLSLYGEAIMNKVLALVQIAYKLADTAGRLLAAQQNEAVWHNLSDNIADEEQRLAVLESFVYGRYMDIKRSLFVALENYRAAYKYFHLKDSPTTISLDMDFTGLTEALSGVSKEVGDLINPSSPQVQDFENCPWSIPVDGIIGTRSADDSITWTISVDDETFVNKLTPSHSKAVYLDKVEFLLYPEPPVGTTVQLKGLVSGGFTLAPIDSGESLKFVCEQPFDLDAEYTVKSDGLNYTTSWEPASLIKAYYMKPAPFTAWTLTLVNPISATEIERIDLKLTGVYWH